MKLEEIIGHNVRGFRKRLSLTQASLAEKADLHPTYLGEIERGSANLTIAVLQRVAKALKVDPNILLIKGAFLDSDVHQHSVRKN